MRIFAAGSLRHAFTAMLGAFREHRSVEVSTLYGPSGKLRERIEAGDVPDLFAAASIAHVDALVRAGILVVGMPLARDSLCVLARPGVDIDASPLIDTLLDPAIRLGTSTPGADPSGDYTWEVFRRIGAQRMGAFAVLDAKAVKLTGAAIEPRQHESPYARLLLVDRRVDVFVTYCANAQAAIARHPMLRYRRFADDVNVAAEFGIGVARDAVAAAPAFLQFACDRDGRRILASFGFDVD